MKPKLILIEGLPGSGKTTTAGLVHELLTDMKLNAKLFLEGDAEHPADYEGVACLTAAELAELGNTYTEYSTLLNDRVIELDGRYMLEYRKLKEELGEDFPDKLLADVSGYDIYELPLELNRTLITKRWQRFAADALIGPDVFIFDCCFIQNPVTIGTIKYGAAKEAVMSYVAELAAIAGPLKPLLIYVEQQDLDYSFRKAVMERPVEWSEGFIHYYTNQGHGAHLGCQGVEGTLQVLKARQELEAEIVSSLTLAKHTVDNSAFEMNSYRQSLAKLLADHFSSAH